MQELFEKLTTIYNNAKQHFIDTEKDKNILSEELSYLELFEPRFNYCGCNNVIYVYHDMDGKAYIRENKDFNSGNFDGTFSYFEYDDNEEPNEPQCYGDIDTITKYYKYNIDCIIEEIEKWG